jgi:hypothetical protein
VRRSVIDDARAWLREAIAAEPRPASVLREEATASGIGRSRLYAACNAEDITIAKERTGQCRWIWTLNDHPDEPELEREGGALPGSSAVQTL